jgi:uncharacterized protein
VNMHSNFAGTDRSGLSDFPIGELSARKKALNERGFLACLWTCDTCAASFHTPTDATPRGWDVSKSTIHDARVTCPDCLELEEQAHIMRTSKPSPPSGGEGDSAKLSGERGPPVSKPQALQMMHSGIIIDLLDPGATPVKLLIDDVAHHLARICRFAGAPDRHYSVAEHSVWVSHRVPTHLALGALLHDAAEAYLGDFTSPLKRCLPDYRAIEDRMNMAIAAKFSAEMMFDAAVKRADHEMCGVEASRMMPHHSEYWAGFKDDPEQFIEYWSPEEATRRFLERYHVVRQWDRMPPAEHGQ